MVCIVSKEAEIFGIVFGMAYKIYPHTRGNGEYFNFTVLTEELELSSK